MLASVMKFVVCPEKHKASTIAMVVLVCKGAINASDQEKLTSNTLLNHNIQMKPIFLTTLAL